MPLAAGSSIGPYDIVGLIGTGGMGEVYRARDRKLHRDVALKILPEAFATDAERLTRFEREARALAALNHPHIAQIYGVEESNRARALVIELVEGETLAERIRHGPLTLDEALALAQQVAEALEAAHEQGIIHRDLKPANIAVRSDGTVKVLDFGLAKLVERSGVPPTAPESAETETQVGIVLGSVPYMAPEQAKGKPVDRRADLWAFGCVLFEMLSGRRAFAGETASEVLGQILEREPDWQRLPRKTPAGIRALLQRCLAKDPKRRLDSAAVAGLELDEAITTPLTATPGASNAVRLWRAMAVTCLALFLTTAAWMLSRLPAPVPSVPDLLNPLQVTNALGIEDFPAWSPDGRMLAYAAGAAGDVEGGNWDIWVAQIGGEQPLNRTAGSLADDRFPSWSPDGRQLAFWSDRDGGGCYIMPALAGNARRVAAASLDDPNPPAWSPDGHQLACVVQEGTDVLVEIHDLRDGQSRRIVLPGERGTRLFLSWSPDGQSFAYIDTPAGLRSDATQLRVLRLNDGSAFTIADGLHRTWSPSWSPDGGAVYFVSNMGGAMDLWRQRIGPTGVPAGQPERVTSGVGMRTARLSPDGRRLAYSQGRRVANVWRLPIVAAQRPWMEARQVTFDHAYIEYVAVSHDGARLLVTSDRSGNPDLWVVPVNGGEMQLVVGGPSPDWGGDWSPDDQTIVFYSYRTGNRDLWLVPANGGPARQLTVDPAADLLPSWSPDGKEIAFLSNRGGPGSIWIVPATGGPARELTGAAKGQSLVPRWSPDGPRWSPDGKWLAAGGEELWRLSATNAAPEIRLAADALRVVWAGDGRSLYFRGGRQRPPNIYAVSSDGTDERLVADLTGRRGTLGDIATDGISLFFTWEESLGDIWVMDVVDSVASSR